MKMFITALSVFASFAAFADAVTAGWYERAFVDVPDGVQTVQDGKLSVVPGGSLYKTGAGTLVVPQSILDRTYPEFNLKVATGRVRFVDDGTGYSVARPAVLDDAAFWVDETSIVNDGEDRAALWNDVRETSAAGSHAHRYAEPIWDEGHPELPLYHVNPSIVEKGGHGGVDFGGFGKGQAMIWKDATGETSELTGIRHLYMVTTVERGWSSPVQSMTCADLRSGSWGTQWGEMYCGAQVNNPAGSDDAVYYFNGVRMDLCKTQPIDMPNGGMGLMLIDIGFYGQKGCQSGNFFCLQGLSGYFGGDTLHEMVAFTKTLSSEDEQAVRRYLMHKYGLAAGADFAVTVTLGDGGGLDVAASAADYPDAAAARGAAALPSIAGTGKIVKTGDGAAVLTVENPLSSVEVKIDGGLVAQRTPVAVALAGGMTVNSDGDGFFGDELTVSSTASAGTVVKTGTGLVVANRIPSDVQTVNVEAGTFALRSVCQNGLESVEHPSVTIPNASFEDNQFNADGTPKSSEPALFNDETNPNKGSSWPTEDYTWVFEALEGGYHNNCWVFYMDGSGTWQRHNWASAEKPAPDGLWALALKGHYRAWTRVEVVEKGRYELSFKAVSRDGKPSGLDVNLSPGTTSADIVADGHLGYAFPLGNVYQTYSYETDELEPGTYVLSVSDTILDNFDHTQSVDDFRMERIPEHDIAGVWPLPNGDFEDVEPVMGGFYDPWSWGNQDYFNLNRVKDWVITGLNDDATVGGGMSRIQPIPTGSYLNHYQSFSRCSGYRCFAGGGVELAFLGGEETASLTFTPPAGTWRLCCDGKRWQGSTQIGGVGASAGNLLATVTVGSETLSFGTADISNWCVDTCLWPDSLTFDGETEVTLKLKLADANGVAIVDNFRLVPPAAGGIVELVGDPGFETRWGGPWADNPVNGNAMWFSYADAGVIQHFTSDRCEGLLGIRIDNTSYMTQSIVIPEDGVYRLSFWSMSRPDGPYAQLATQKNPIQVWLEKDEVREVVATAETPTTNFVEHVFLTSLKAGSYTLGVQGTYADEDKTGTRSSLIDKMSLTRYAEESFAPAPALDENLSLHIARGAKLRLDFTGTAKIKELTHGGAYIGGEVSAATHPDFVEGPGVLYTKTRGFSVIIR